MDPGSGPGKAPELSPFPNCLFTESPQIGLFKIGNIWVKVSRMVMNDRGGRLPFVQNEFPQSQFMTEAFLTGGSGNGLKNSQAFADPAAKGRGMSTPPNAVYGWGADGGQIAGNGRRRTRRHRLAPDRMRCSIEHFDAQRPTGHESRAN